MIDRRVRWALLLAPLVLPWVWISWGDGSYTMFSLGWFQGGHFVSVLTPLENGAFTARNYIAAFPMGVGLYLLGVVVAAVGSHSSWIRVGVAAIYFLAGLFIGFFALGIGGQAGILAVPFGVLWLWGVAIVEYYEYYTTG